MLALNLYKHLRIKKMRTKLLIVAFLLLSWQAVTIVSTLYNRLDARATQLELLIQDLEK